MSLRRVGLLLVGALVLAAPVPAGAQLFFSDAPSPDLRIAPLTIRAAVTPAPGPVQVRILFSVTAPAGAAVSDLYLLWPGEVKGDPALGARDPALAQAVTALRFDVVEEGRLPLRARQVSGEGGAAAREPVPGGAPYVTFVQTGGALGLSAPATWIRIPASPRLADADWLMTLEIPSLSVVKPKPTSWIERWFLGERRLLAISFNEARGRPLRRMYLAQRDRVVRLGDAPAEMTVSFSEADHLKIDSIAPTTAVRGLSETAESTETVALFLDTGEGSTPQRLNVQYGVLLADPVGGGGGGARGTAPPGLRGRAPGRARLAGRRATADRALSRLRSGTGRRERSSREWCSRTTCWHASFPARPPMTRCYGFAGPTPRSRSASRPPSDGPSSTTAAGSARRRGSCSACSPRFATSRWSARK